MNSFDRCRLLEARSLSMLQPFLEETQGRYVLTDKGRLAPFLQRTVGDLLFNDAGGRVWTVELKAEREWTGNLFLEIWSNCNFADRNSYVMVGPRPGWLLTLCADLLFYHFPDRDKLVIFNLQALQQWAFLHDSRNMSEPDGRGERRRLKGRVFDFRHAQQKQHEQKNVTVGAVVPLTVLQKEVSPAPKLFSVRQLSMDLLGGEAA